MILKILQFVRNFLQIVRIFCHDLTDLTICKDFLQIVRIFCHDLKDLTICKDFFADCKDFLS